MSLCLFFSECLRENIEYENTEQVPEALYADGETVRVNCMPGYIGLYKLKCEKGKWNEYFKRSCASKTIINTVTT